MPDPHYAELIQQGHHQWNDYRKKNPDDIPDLCDMDFRGTGAMLMRCNLDRAMLMRANFQGTTLLHTSLKEAVLYDADFCGADLLGTNLKGARLLGVQYDNDMTCQGVDVSGCTGSQHFVRHVMDMDYIRETQEKHPIRHYWWSITSDCGRSWPLWAAWCCAILYVFWAIFDILKVSRPFVTSIMAFTSFGFVDSNKHATPELIFICIEAMLGYIMFGALVSLIASQMGRRSG